MPVYEYLCGGCEAQTEQLVLAGDIASAPLCPTCGSHDMKRLLSTFAAQASDGGRSSSYAKSSFDPGTACGGGPCRMPDACGAGADN
jgi:putative FmdB family regulatory protein